MTKDLEELKLELGLLIRVQKLRVKTLFIRKKRISKLSSKIKKLLRNHHTGVVIL